MLILFSAFQAAYLTLKNGGNPVACIVILFLPTVYSNYILSIRQGVALAFFLTGWFSKNNVTKFVLISLTPFIHTSFYISIFLLFLRRVALKYPSYAYLNIVAFSTVCMLIIFLIPHIGVGLGVRQSETYASTAFEVVKGSGLGLIFWFLLLIVFLNQGKIFLHQNIFSTFCIIFYLLSYIFATPLARTLQNHSILILISGLYLTGVNKKTFYCLINLFLAYTIFNAVNFGLISEFLQP